MSDFIKKLLTEADNATPCIARLSIGIGVIAMAALSGAHWYFEHAFASNDFGIGMGSLLAGGGALIFGKRDKETPS